MLKVATLLVVAFVVFDATWALASAAASDAVARPVASAVRAAPVARAVGFAPAPEATAIVEVDGMRFPVGGGTVGEALRAAGLAVGAGDRLSQPLSAAVVPGLRIVVERGVVLSLVESGRAVPIRAPRGATVAEALAANGMELGPLDRLEQAATARVAAGDVIRVVRVADRESTIRESVAYAVEMVRDADMPYGRVIVLSSGVLGLAENTYLVRVADGSEVGRTLLASRELVAPVTEIRRVGMKPPPAPSEIDTIIREAAERWGADPQQMLRVAWCESRFDPAAFNPRHSDSGLFQFIPATWAANSVRAGYAGASPFDAIASANVAAMMFGRGQASAWTCK